MKKHLGIASTLALALAFVPATFGQAQDQNSPTTTNPPAQAAPGSPASNPSSTLPDSTQPSASPSSTMPQQDQSSPAAGSGSMSTAQADSANSFTGTVVKAGSKYVLKTGSNTYQLDDQSKASQFEGKEVKVNGSLDKTTSVIHVTDIAPISQS